MDASFEQIIEQYHHAMIEFYRGNPVPVKQLTSNQQDVSLAGAFGNISVGTSQVTKAMDINSSKFKDGQNVKYENLVKYSSHDLGYIVEIERFDAKVGGRQEISRIALRVTSIFRLESNSWKLVHRQGDSLVESIDVARYLSFMH